MNPDQLVCGYVVVFGEPSKDGRPAEHLDDGYRALVAVGAGLPLLVDHLPAVTPRGVHPFYGQVVDLALVTTIPGLPAGIVGLVQVDADDFGDSLIAAVRSGQLWAFSLGGNGRPEVSLTSRPAFASCRVLGLGADALSAWELLSGDRVAVTS